MKQCDPKKGVLARDWEQLSLALTFPELAM